MVETLEVCLPVTHVLVVDSVDNMLAQNQKGLVGVGLPSKQVGRNQVGLMYRGALIATTDGGQYLLAKPGEICFEVHKQGWRRENPRERFVTVQQVLRISLDHDVHSVEQSLQIPLLDKWCAEIGHDEVTDEHHLLIGQVNQHRIMSLTALDRD